MVSSNNLPQIKPRSTPINKPNDVEPNPRHPRNSKEREREERNSSSSITIKINQPQLPTTLKPSHPHSHSHSNTNANSNGARRKHQGIAVRDDRSSSGNGSRHFDRERTRMYDFIESDSDVDSAGEGEGDDDDVMVDGSFVSPHHHHNNSNNESKQHQRYDDLLPSKIMQSDIALSQHFHHSTSNSKSEDTTPSMSLLDLVDLNLHTIPSFSSPLSTPYQQHHHHVHIPPSITSKNKTFNPALLRVCVLSHNRLTSIAPLKGCGNLIEIDVGFNFICRLQRGKATRHKISQSKLDANANINANVNAVEDDDDDEEDDLFKTLKSLAILRINHNNIKDINELNCLEACENLVYICIRDNPITSTHTHTQTHTHAHANTHTNTNAHAHKSNNEIIIRSLLMRLCVNVKAIDFNVLTECSTLLLHGGCEVPDFIVNPAHNNAWIINTATNVNVNVMNKMKLGLFTENQTIRITELSIIYITNIYLTLSPVTVLHSFCRRSLKAKHARIFRNKCSAIIGYFLYHKIHAKRMEYDVIKILQEFGRDDLLYSSQDSTRNTSAKILQYHTRKYITYKNESKCALFVQRWYKRKKANFHVLMGRMLRERVCGVVEVMFEGRFRGVVEGVVWGVERRIREEVEAKNRTRIELVATNMKNKKNKEVNEIDIDIDREENDGDVSASASAEPRIHKAMRINEGRIRADTLHSHDNDEHDDEHDDDDDEITSPIPLQDHKLTNTNSNDDIDTAQKTRIEPSRISCIHKPTYVHILTTDCETDGIFRYNRSRNGHDNGHGDVEVCRLKLNNRNRNRNGSHDRDIHHNHERFKRRYVHGTRYEFDIWVNTLHNNTDTMTHLDPNKVKVKVMHKYTEPNIQKLTTILKILSRDHPHIHIFLSSQITRLSSCVLIQSSYRSWSTRNNLRPSIDVMLSRSRALRTLQAFTRNSIYLLKRLRYLSILSSYVNTIHSSTVCLDLDLFFILNNYDACRRMKRVVGMGKGKCGMMHGVRFGFWNDSVYLIDDDDGTVKKTKTKTNTTLKTKNKLTLMNNRRRTLPNISPELIPNWMSCKPMTMSSKYTENDNNISALVMKGVEVNFVTLPMQMNKKENKKENKMVMSLKFESIEEARKRALLVCMISFDRDVEDFIKFSSFPDIEELNMKSIEVVEEASSSPAARKWMPELRELTAGKRLQLEILCQIHTSDVRPISFLPNHDDDDDVGITNTRLNLNDDDDDEFGVIEGKSSPRYKHIANHNSNDIIGEGDGDGETTFIQSAEYYADIVRLKSIVNNKVQLSSKRLSDISKIEYVKVKKEDQELKLQNIKRREHSMLGVVNESELVVSKKINEIMRLNHALSKDEVKAGKREATKDKRIKELLAIQSNRHKRDRKNLNVTMAMLNEKMVLRDVYNQKIEDGEDAVYENSMVNSKRREDVKGFGREKGREREVVCGLTTVLRGFKR